MAFVRRFPEEAHDKVEISNIASFVAETGVPSVAVIMATASMTMATRRLVRFAKKSIEFTILLGIRRASRNTLFMRGNVLGNATEISLVDFVTDVFSTSSSGVIGTVRGLQRAEVEAFGLCSDSVVVKSRFEDAFKSLHCRERESYEQYTDDDADYRHDQEEQYRRNGGGNDCQDVNDHEAEGCGDLASPSLSDDAGGPFDRGYGPSFSETMTGITKKVMNSQTPSIML